MPIRRWRKPPLTRPLLAANAVCSIAVAATRCGSQAARCQSPIRQPTKPTAWPGCNCTVAFPRSWNSGDFPNVSEAMQCVAPISAGNPRSCPKCVGPIVNQHGMRCDTGPHGPKATL